jgi:hypothetical protein
VRCFAVLDQHGLDHFGRYLDVLIPVGEHGCSSTEWWLVMGERSQPGASNVSVTSRDEATRFTPIGTAAPS